MTSVSLTTIEPRTRSRICKYNRRTLNRRTITCAADDVLFAPRVMVVRLLPDLPVYVIVSLPDRNMIEPELGKAVASVSVMEVPEPPVPLVSARRAPFKVPTTLALTEHRRHVQ